MLELLRNIDNFLATYTSFNCEICNGYMTYKDYGYNNEKISITIYIIENNYLWLIVRIDDNEFVVDEIFKTLEQFENFIYENFNAHLRSL